MTTEQNKEIEQNLVQFGQLLYTGLSNDAEKTIVGLKTLNTLIAENRDVIPFLMKPESQKMMQDFATLLGNQKKMNLGQIIKFVTKTFKQLK